MKSFIVPMVCFAFVAFYGFRFPQISLRLAKRPM